MEQLMTTLEVDLYQQRTNLRVSWSIYVTESEHFGLLFEYSCAGKALQSDFLTNLVLLVKFLPRDLDASVDSELSVRIFEFVVSTMHDEAEC